MGAAAGSFFPAVGTAVGAAVGAVTGGLFGCMKWGKHEDQLMRDQVRDLLVQAGVLDARFGLQLADGTRYDLGKDGGPRAEFGGRRPYEVDFSSPFAAQAVAWVDPLIELFAGGDTKIQHDFAGYFANAAMSNALTLDEVRANIDAIYRAFGMSLEKGAPVLSAERYRFGT
jgi:hypothetical protein